MEIVVILKWITGGLLSCTLALIVYIWQDHRSRERDDRDGLKSAFSEALKKLEEAIRTLDSTVRALRESVSARIDDLEDRQNIIETALATERQRINGVIAVCRERARHYPMFAAGEGAAHFHRRMSEQGDAPRSHCRSTNGDTTNDGSD